ncbi:MAG: cell wall hydrolase [Firmicutes bacterium]|nr:cell wall hydrolase [Bacillota bacterium]
MKKAITTITATILIISLYLIASIDISTPATAPPIQAIHEPTPTPAPAQQHAPRDRAQVEISVEETTKETTEEYTEAEKILIARVVYAEARGECFDGQVAVAQVVINRVESGKYGKSVKRVVYAKHQFAVGKKYNDQNMQAVEYAIANRDYPDNMYFFRRSKSKTWYDFDYYIRIGNHSFYTRG